MNGFWFWFWRPFAELFALIILAILVLFGMMCWSFWSDVRRAWKARRAAR